MVTSECPHQLMDIAVVSKEASHQVSIQKPMI